MAGPFYPNTDRDDLLQEMETAARMVCREQCCEGGSQLSLAMDVAAGIRRTIATKIASGELAVVKTAKAFQAPSFTGTFEGVGCHGCGRSYPKASEPFNHCPGCGSLLPLL